MATATQKITLSSSRDIPFNKLVLSQSNVRRVKAGISVEELAESIARRGLIQSLHVRPELDAEGQETGLFEVPAGGRRYRALEFLIKQKRLNKTTPVPCIVSEAGDDILIDEVSLAENIERAPLHPLDQFRRTFGPQQGQNLGSRFRPNAAQDQRHGLIVFRPNDIGQRLFVHRRQVFPDSAAFAVFDFSGHTSFR